MSQRPDLHTREGDGFVELLFSRDLAGGTWLEGSGQGTGCTSGLRRQSCLGGRWGRGGVELGKEEVNPGGVRPRSPPFSKTHAALVWQSCRPSASPLGGFSTICGHSEHSPQVEDQPVVRAGHRPQEVGSCSGSVSLGLELNSICNLKTVGSLSRDV